MSMGQKNRFLIMNVDKILIAMYKKNVEKINYK